MKPQDIEDCSFALQEAAYILEYWYKKGAIPNYLRLAEDLQDYAQDLEDHSKTKH